MWCIGLKFDAGEDNFDFTSIFQSWVEGKAQNVPALTLNDYYLKEAFDQNPLNFNCDLF